MYLLQIEGTDGEITRIINKETAQLMADIWKISPNSFLRFTLVSYFQEKEEQQKWVEFYRASPVAQPLRGTPSAALRRQFCRFGREPDSIIIQQFNKKEGNKNHEQKQNQIQSHEGSEIINFCPTKAKQSKFPERTKNQ